MSNQAKKQTSVSSGRFNGFIIPMIVILTIIPLIIHLKLYDTHLEDKAYFLEETYPDIFLYYKSLFFIIICTIMLVLTIAQAVIKHDRLKFSRVFIPLAIYAVLSFLSAVCSEYGAFPFTGIYEQFESVWVLLGYAMTVYYCFIFISSAKDVNVLMNALLIGTVIMLLIGLSQAFRKDIFRTELGRKIILPMEYWSNKDAKLSFQFPLGRVYLTLYNPNYVGSYVALISPVFLLLAFAKKKIWYAVICIAAFVGLLLCILGSGSRAGFAGVALSLFLLVLIFNKRLVKFLPEALIVIVLIVGVVYTYNNYTNDQLLSKVRQALSIEESEYTLKQIDTNDENVVIHYNENELKLSVNVDLLNGTVNIDDNNILDENNLPVSHEANPDADGNYNFKLTDDRFASISFKFEVVEGFPTFRTTIDGKSWDFVYSVNDETYYYVTNKGKLDKTHNAPYVESLSNKARAFSGRGFIWSRTLPILTESAHNFILGTGPDTFLLAFPNDDYVAMANGGYATELITKPHNMYLQIAVQTGVPSLICFLVFYFWYFFASLRLYRKADKTKYLPLVGIGILCGTFGYMVVGIINDAMVVITPIYWTMIGIGLAINFIIKRDNIFPVVTEVTDDKKSKKKKASVNSDASEATETSEATDTSANANSETENDLVADSLNGNDSKDDTEAADASISQSTDSTDSNTNITGQSKPEISRNKKKKHR